MSTKQCFWSTQNKQKERDKEEVDRLLFYYCARAWLDTSVCCGEKELLLPTQSIFCHHYFSMLLNMVYTKPVRDLYILLCCQLGQSTTKSPPDYPKNFQNIFMLLNFNLYLNIRPLTLNLHATSIIYAFHNELPTCNANMIQPQ